jgi:uncharacterized protein (DUF2267 family)
MTMSQIAYGTLGYPVESIDPWLNELMGLLQWNDKRRAYRAMTAVLHALRDRLSPDAASLLAEQLPEVVRSDFYEDYQPVGKPLFERRTEDFLAQVATELSDWNNDFQPVTQAVLKVLSSLVSATELDHVLAKMPKGIRDLTSGA